LQQQYEIFNQLESAVNAKEKQRKKKHRVFEASSDIKPCYTEKFLLQKLNYIHNNATAAKWQLAKLPEEYFHSSASFYILNGKIWANVSRIVSALSGRRYWTLNL